MRTDEKGDSCPETLGEYRDLCLAISPLREKSQAVLFLDTRIEEAEQGREESVITSDSQMRGVLMPMLLKKG